MNILEILESARTAIEEDSQAGGHLGADIQELAIDAVTDGFGSESWNKYMSLFADNKAQLERLTTRSAAEPPYYRIGRAYIVANSTCSPDTNSHLAKDVKPKIQEFLSGEPDGKIVDKGPGPKPPGVVVRPLKIPR